MYPEALLDKWDEAFDELRLARVHLSERRGLPDEESARLAFIHARAAYYEVNSEVDQFDADRT